MDYIYLEDLNEGDVFWSGEITVDREEMLAHSRKFDPWPYHVDEEAAKATPYGRIIASGVYTFSLWSQLYHHIMNNPERPWAFLGGFDFELKFPNPVYPGDRLRERLTLISVRESSKSYRGIIKGLFELFNQDEQLVLSVLATGLVRRRPKKPSERGENKKPR